MGPFCDGPAPQHRTAAEDQHHDDDDRASLEGARNGPLGRRLDGAIAGRQRRGVVGLTSLRQVHLRLPARLGPGAELCPLPFIY
jgi:hypothetical protein